MAEEEMETSSEADLYAEAANKIAQTSAVCTGGLPCGIATFLSSHSGEIW